MVRKPIIYQLLPRLFGNSCPSPVLNATIEQNGCGKFNDINEAALHSIKDLGVSHIWLTGIIQHATQTDYSKVGISTQHPSVVKGKAGSPYAVTNFFDLDPDLAQNVESRWKEFELCRNRIQSAGFGLIIDFIPNHTAREYRNEERHLQGKDLGQQDDSSVMFSPNNNYYYLPENPLQLPNCLLVSGLNDYIENPAKATGNDCFTANPSINDWYETVKINYGLDYQNSQSHFHPTPPTWNYMLEVLLFWAEKGIDGFRCDMVEMVPVEFWSWSIPQVKKHFPQLLFIGEVYNPTLYDRFLNEAGFDFLYDKVDLYDQLRLLIEGKGDAQQITHIWQKQEGFRSRMLRFLENHDEQRLASDFVGGDGFKSLSALALTACFDQAAVMIYFGQELGETAKGEAGFSGDDGKTTIFDYWTIPSIKRLNNSGLWNDSALQPEEEQLRSTYSKLLNFCLINSAIQTGSFYDLQFANIRNDFYKPHINYSFLRFYELDRLLVVCSFCDSEQWLRVIIPKEVWFELKLSPKGFYHFQDAITGEKMEAFAQATYESDGGSSGLLMQLPSFGFRIWKILDN